MAPDIVVIGAGPAGLSAAVRATWLGAPGAHYQPRVLVLDAGDAPGGLSRWQPLVVNSPGIFFTRRELKALLRTCAATGVEFRRERVIALEPTGEGGFSIATTRAHYQAPAVIVASGCRLGHPAEHRLFHRKRILWFYDHASLDDLVRQLAGNSAIRHVVLCGSEAVAETRRHLSAPVPFSLRCFAEPPYTTAPAADVERARLTAIAIDTNAHCLQLRFEQADGEAERVACDVLLVDFNAYEKHATSLGFLHLPAARQADGYLDADRRMRSSVGGLFVAGDATGAPFSVAKAMSEGTIAGFSAHDHVCRLRTGRAPNHFPFYPTTF